MQKSSPFSIFFHFIGAKKFTFFYFLSFHWRSRPLPTNHNRRKFFKMNKRISILDQLACIRFADAEANLYYAFYRCSPHESSNSDCTPLESYSFMLCGKNNILLNSRAGGAETKPLSSECVKCYPVLFLGSGSTFISHTYSCTLRDNPNN